MHLFFQSETSLFATEATLLGLFIVIIVVGLVARYLRLPYTTVLVVAGLGLEFLRFLPKIELTPELVLLLFLPPLAFDAAFHLDFDTLRQDLPTISTFALLGVMVTMLVTGAILVWGLGWSWELALLFGTLVAATDPVSVVAAFRELGVSKRLSTIVEGESLFNDGTSIVLFRIVLTVVVASAFNLPASILEFMRLVIGGIALGFALGYLTARAMIRIDDYLVEISATVVLAWGSYLLGEYLGVSGIITVVVAGLVLGNYGGRVSFSPTTKIVLAHVLEFVSFVANSFIFLLIGLQVELSDLSSNLQPILWAIAATLVGRAIAVYSLSLPLGRFSNPIPLRWQHLLFWGGLRGGVTLALALSLPIIIPDRESLIVAAFGVVLFTLVVQGLTIEPFLKSLRLVPITATHRDAELARARLLSLRAVEHRLKRLRDEGAITQAVHKSLTAEYDSMAGELEEKLRVLYQQHPDLTENEIGIARLEALRSERSALFDLNRRGLISDDVYRELTTEVDAGLQHFMRTPAQRRAAETGPEAPEEVKEA
jgi:Na+:H+ antiporter